MDQEDHEYVMIEDMSLYVKNGFPHGYWKDVLNLLALSANDQLSVLGTLAKVFNINEKNGGDKQNVKTDVDQIRE